ncbi:MAG: hypothetical protein ACO1QB_12795 [Verrucomicrobiales bacterium]
MKKTLMTIINKTVPGVALVAEMSGATVAKAANIVIQTAVPGYRRYALGFIAACFVQMSSSFYPALAETKETLISYSVTELAPIQGLPKKDGVFIKCAMSKTTKCPVLVAWSPKLRQWVEISPKVTNVLKIDVSQALAQVESQHSPANTTIPTPLAAGPKPKVIEPSSPLPQSQAANSNGNMAAPKGTPPATAGKPRLGNAYHKNSMVRQRINTAPRRVAPYGGAPRVLNSGIKR